jgi:hypothetical protein
MKYGNPDLKLMKNRLQQYPCITKEEDTYDKLMMKYDFRCYGCKSTMVKMVDNDEERYICRWFTEWETIQAPTIQECLNCGGHGPGGYKCALCWTRDNPTVEGDKPMTVIASLKYYLKNRRVHLSNMHMNYAWYAYTRYIITLALEEKIWSMTLAECVSDPQPIRFGICIAGEDVNIYKQRDEKEGCRLRQEDTTEKKFQLQTGRRCRCCNNKLYW